MANYLGLTTGTTTLDYIAALPTTYVGFNTLVGGTDMDVYLDGELVGGSYVRKLVTFTVTDGLMENVETLMWLDLPADDINSLFIIDTASGAGEVVFTYDFAAPYTIASGSGLIFGAGVITASVDITYVIDTIITP